MGSNLFIGNVMDLDSLYKLAGIAAFIIGGANFVVVLVAKTFWKLTFERKEKEDESKFKKIDDQIEMIKSSIDSHESKNVIARHNFDVVTKSVYNRMDSFELSITKAIESGFQNMKGIFDEKIKLFDEKIKNVNERINEKK